MPRAKGSGKTPGSGRKKGAPNKLSKEIREMVKEALERAGGVEYLMAVALENPSAFLSLVGKLVPAEIRAEVDGRVTLEDIIAGTHKYDD